MIAGAAAVTAAAGAVVAGVRTDDLASKNDRLEHNLSSYELGALAAARSYTLTFATYRYDDLDADFAATEAHSVDPFLSQYRSKTELLRTTLIAAKASSTATVVSAGLASISPTRAVVDLFLDQTIVNSRGTQPATTQRVELTLARRHGRWLISNLVLP
ncbi:MAG: hypothetical protein ACTHK4_16900 [Mycobacteriales bacterium]